MQLAIEDFKKVGYTQWNDCVVLKNYPEKYSVEVFIYEDEVICTVYILNARVSYIELPVDKLTTIQEIESTIEEMYNAIVGV